MNPMYDNALLGILQNEGKIERFLDVIFGFLMRRTDFYHLMTADQKKLGFPPGVSLRMVLQAFERYKSMFEQYEQQRQESNRTSTTSTLNKLEGIGDVLEDTKSKPTEVPRDDARQNGQKEKVPDFPHPEVSVEKNHDLPPSTADADKVPGVYQADPDCYNGAAREDYTWSQTIKDVDVKLKVPSHIKSGRDLSVDVQRKRIKVATKSNGCEQVLFERTLCWDILRDETVWTFNPIEAEIHFCLDKVQERWWEAAFEGEEKINTRQIDCSRPMHELDEEAQAKIHQLMYDQQCKRQGLPTSKQKGMQDILAEAWNKEGSPFKGTPFDPSKIDMVPSNLG